MDEMHGFAPYGIIKPSLPWLFKILGKVADYRLYTHWFLWNEVLPGIIRHLMGDNFSEVVSFHSTAVVEISNRLSLAMPDVALDSKITRRNCMDIRSVIMVS